MVIAHQQVLQFFISNLSKTLRTMKSILKLVLILSSILILPNGCNQNGFMRIFGNPILATIQNFPVFKFMHGVIGFQAKFAIDADGSPRAYGPNDSGLDLTQHAYNVSSKRWMGIVTDENCKPLIQKQGDPHPGLYISQTSLYDTTYPNCNPRRFVNAEKIPYIVLSLKMMALTGAKVGDISYVYNPTTDKSSYAVFGDVGPEELLGEGSIYLAQILGIPNTSPRDGGLSGSAIQYVVFPDSGLGNGRHPTIAQIDSIGKMAMERIGGETVISKHFQTFTSVLP